MEDDEQGEVTQAELVEGLTFVRTLFRELGEELLSFSRDEVEVRPHVLPFIANLVLRG